MLSDVTRGRLERYLLASTVMSPYAGERSSKEMGRSVEFHEFRNYQVGDELRYVDWKAYARTGKLYTRLFQAEQTINVHLLLDTTASMQANTTEASKTQTKHRYAQLAAEVISQVSQHDARTQVHLFNGQASSPAMTKAQVFNLSQFIDHAPTLSGDEFSPARAITNFALNSPANKYPGLLIVISDLFARESLDTALIALKKRGFDASFLHLLNQQDITPSHLAKKLRNGGLELIDAETGEVFLVDTKVISAYETQMQHFLETTQRTITQLGFRYVRLVLADDLIAPNTAFQTNNAQKQALENYLLKELLKHKILIKR